MKKMQMIAIALVALSFLTAFFIYPQMPDKVASHWGINGKVNGYMGKGIGTLFVPVLSLFLFALFYVLPRLDPLKKNYASFQKEYDALVALIVGFLYYTYLLTLAFNLGFSLDILRFLSPALAALVFYLGIILSKAKQNWFVGIRTPWTLSSKKVWDRTHAICSKMFKAAGMAALIGIFLPAAALIASIAILLFASVFGFVYSYYEFGKERKGRKNK